MVQGGDDASQLLLDVTDSDLTEHLSGLFDSTFADQPVRARLERKRSWGQDPVRVCDENEVGMLTFREARR